MVVTGVGMVGVDPVDEADVVGILVQIHPYLEVLPNPEHSHTHAPASLPREV